jgi:hypothetical protein
VPFKPPVAAGACFFRQDPVQCMHVVNYSSELGFCLGCGLTARELVLQGYARTPVRDEIIKVRLPESYDDENA